jgi:hypothetical protein
MGPLPVPPITEMMCLAFCHASHTLQCRCSSSVAHQTPKVLPAEIEGVTQMSGGFEGVEHPGKPFQEEVRLYFMLWYLFFPENALFLVIPTPSLL